MKKILVLLLAFVMVLGLCACGDNSGATNESGGDKASATIVVTGSKDQSGSEKPEDPQDDRVALDVFSGLTAKVNATINGFGSSIKLEYDYTKVDYDKSNADIKEFIKDIEFYTDEYSNLSNGDKYVVHASWSKATADALGIKLLEESKEYTVDSLYDVYRTAAEVPSNLSIIDEIEDAIIDAAERYYDQHDWYEGYDISYRYFYDYANDKAGNPYIHGIYITAVAVFEEPDEYMADDRVVTFLGDNYLYQEYWEMRRTASAAESNRVSANGDLSEEDDTVKLEEFFPN